jgi:hypothetical protein
MGTVTLTLADYNGAKIRAALAAWSGRNGNAVAALGRVGTGGAGRGIQGHENPLSGTRINTGDPRGLSVDAGPVRKGGRRALPPAERRARRRATWRISQARRRGPASVTPKGAHQ